MSRILKVSLGTLMLLAAFLLFSVPAFAIEVGDQAPDFTLKDYNGKEVSLSDFSDKLVVLEWFNKGCPFVVKHYRNEDMQALQSKYQDKGVIWLTINSTRKDHRDFLDAAAAEAVKKKWNIEHALMLKDTDGKVGKMYGAKTTPHMYVINKGKLAYVGAIDDNPSAYADPKKSKNFVAAALDDLIEGQAVATTYRKPYGCAVKYDS